MKKQEKGKKMTAIYEDTRCMFLYADGRRCRMLRMEGHDTLCCHHWSREEELDTAAKAAKSLTCVKAGLGTARGINDSLVQLYTLVAEGKMPFRRAMGMGYLAQLILQSLPGARREQEEWTEIIKGLMAPVKSAVAGVQSREKSGKATAAELAALQLFQEAVYSGLVAGIASGKSAGEEKEGTAGEEPGATPADVEKAARELLQVVSLAQQAEKQPVPVGAQSAPEEPAK